MPNIDDDLAPHIPTRPEPGDDTFVAEAGDDTLSGEEVEELFAPGASSLDEIEADWQGDDAELDDEDDGTDSDEWEEPIDGFDLPEEDDGDATETLPDDFDVNSL